SNPIFTLIYNGFRQVSNQAGLDYFANPEARKHSQDFYRGLLEDLHHNDPQSASDRTARVMQDSLDFWKNCDFFREVQ
ncbi:MAG: hypothetical protein RBS09_09525, partial [Anaerolineaceae bacterium]|nr:hypothetical protein [Anaerolineaceae bacterium]